MRATLNPNRWALVPIAFACAALATPWLFAYSPAVALALRRGFAVVCHQQPDRSFFSFGGSVAVCARCLGIYLGAAAGLLVRVSRRVAWRCLMGAVAINLADWLAELAGLHGNWIVSRSVLGCALGIAAGILVGNSAPNHHLATDD